MKMEENNMLHVLKVNAYRHYLDNDLDPSVPWYSDKEYDELEKKLGVKGISLVDFGDQKIRNNNVEKKMKKITGVEDFEKEVRDTLFKLNCKYFINYKYDGSAIRAEYRNGKLDRIKSTPDEETCLDVTDKFRNFFPEEVDEDIVSIRGEVITDPKEFGQKARNKANGLLCSKYLTDEINLYAQVRVYNLEFKDGEYNFMRLYNSLNKLQNTDKFKVAERLKNSEIPTSSIVVSPSGDSVLVDGIVVYSEKEFFAIKFYFTDIQQTTIKDVYWGYNEKNGSYTPTYIIDKVELNEKSIKKVATGGVANMLKIGGIGTKVYVILSKMTIPKVYTNETYKIENKTEDYGNHVCACGNPLDLINDCYGSTLKCSDPKCSQRIKDKESRYDKNASLAYNINEVLGIDRLKVTDLSDDLLGSVEYLKTIDDLDERTEKFKNIFKNCFKLSDMQLKLLDLNAYAFARLL